MAKLIWYGRAPSGGDIEIDLEIDASAEAGADAAIALDRKLKAAGFVATERFAKPPAPTFGGGGGRGVQNKRRGLTPPPGIVVPQHCGAPAEYIIYNKDNATAKAREALTARGVPDGKADMWVCSKDRECEDVKSGKSERPWAGFDMKPEPKPKPAAASAAPAAIEAAAAPPPAQAPAEAPATNGDAPHPAGDAAWASFDAKADAMGYNQETIREIAGTIPVVRGETTRAQLEALLNKMKAAPRRRG